MRYRIILFLLCLGFGGNAQALCPWNTAQDSSLGFCTDANNAFGPFTRAMTDKCSTQGGGPACTDLKTVYFNGTNITGIAVGVQRYSKTFASNLRGTGVCPLGAIKSATYDDRCVESTSAFGTEVYGPFPQKWIDACRAAPISGGNACFLNRWSATIYRSVRSQVASPDWRLPIANGFTTSDWCVCRDQIPNASSPHIGWDIVNNANPMNSVAIESGKITRGPTLNGSCGWEMEITDRFSTVWYYRHMNKPSLTNGQAVSAGQFLGIHRDYPSSGGGCGNGAHLHFERLSAGFFGDSSVTKTCANGARSCNFDPRKPFPAFAKSSAITAVSPLYSNAPELEPAELSEAAIARNRVCRVDPKSYPVLNASTWAALPPAPKSLKIQMSAATSSVGKYSSPVLSARAEFIGNPKNQCVAGKQNCVVSWALYGEQANGRYARMLTDASLRNVTPVIDRQAQFCAPAQNTGRYVLVIKDLQGKQYAHHYGR
jgi:Peptidase family M23